MLTVINSYLNILILKACDVGTFGQDCRYRCSNNCLNDKACDRVDGHCDSCVTGYQRFSCIESKYNQKLSILMTIINI